MDNDLSMLGASTFITSVAETITRMDMEAPDQNLRTTFEDYLGRALLRKYQIRQFLEIDDRDCKHCRALHGMLRRMFDHPSLAAMVRGWLRKND